jgi:hypothetical protein
MKLDLDGQDKLRNFYELQINDLKMGTWAKKLNEEVEKLELAYIWEGRSGHNTNWMCKIIPEKCNDIKRQNSFADINRKNPLLYY